MSNGEKIVSLFQDAYRAAKERYYRDNDIDVDKANMSPIRCVIGWRLFDIILDLEPCPLRKEILIKHKALNVNLEVSHDCPDYGVFFIYE